MVIPNDGGVQSLGILPRVANTTLTWDVPQLRADTVALAVSLERAGGSLKSVPTGPVLYQGAFNKLK